MENKISPGESRFSSQILPSNPRDRPRDIEASIEARFVRLEEAKPALRARTWIEEWRGIDRRYPQCRIPVSFGSGLMAPEAKFNRGLSRDRPPLRYD